METVTLEKGKYRELKEKAELADNLLVKLIRGLEDVKAGRIKNWKNVRD